MNILTVLCVLLPICAGLFLFFKKPEDRRLRNTFSLVVVLLNAVLILVCILSTAASGPQTTAVTLFDFGRGLALAFSFDEASMVFAAIIAVLWPVTTVYAFSYMKHEGMENKFFSFFIITFGVVAGIATARNFFTLYLFYELMTLVTLPLVMHSMDDKARSAGKKYLIYSMTGAAMIFIALIFLYSYGFSLDFTWGGILDPAKTAGKENILQVAFVLGFFGFGVKAALFPFHSWLPAASVAPTPVTALLHAVAVVKSGAFSVMRLIYFGFGCAFLYGTPAQFLAILFAAVTIVYGSAMALRMPHLKRRLAYSTVANLSYILLAFATMTPEGLTGGLLHMIFHAVIKITLFFCAGAILHHAKKEYLDEMEGLAAKMPITCATFLIAALGLIGIPPLGGFISKLTIGTAAGSLAAAGTLNTASGAAASGVMNAASGSLLTAAGILGCVALIVSATLTLLYMMSTVIRFYFPLKPEKRLHHKHQKHLEHRAIRENVHEADRCMTVPLILLAVLSIALALCSRYLLNFLNTIGI